MERKEPSLVPEWLKGAAGGGTGGTLQFSQQSFHQDGSGSLISHGYRSSQPETAGNSRLGEYDSLPHVTMSERELYRRRPDSSVTGLSDRSSSDLGTFFHSKPSFVFGRGSFYHSNEGLDRDSHLRISDHGWNYDKDRGYRDWDKDRASAFTAVNKDKNRESTDVSALQRLSAGKTTRYDIELPLRRVQSMVASRRIDVNGDKEPATELVGALTGSINTTGRLQKADFDRNFPSLISPKKLLAIQSNGLHTQEKLGANNSSFENLSSSAKKGTLLLADVLSPRAAAASSESVLSIREAASSHFIGSTNTTMKETTTKTVEEPSFTRSLSTIKVVSPREKLKPKVIRSVEMGPSIVPKGNLGSNLAVDSLGISQTSGPNAGSTFQRKPKQLFDRRAVPISSSPLNSGTDGGPTQRPKEPGAGAEDKRPSVQVQNRTDFFNTLRRKAAESGDNRSNFVRSDSVLVDKTEEPSKKNELDTSLAISKNYAGDDATKLQESRTKESEVHDNDSKTIFSDSTLETTIIARSNSHGKNVRISANGLIVDEVEFATTKSSMDLSDKVSDAATNYEEEEEAFMRSLGWEDNAEEEEALTEEEIKAFYEQHGKFLATSRTSWHKQRLKDFVMHSYIESPSSISSDLTSSETDSADELNVH
ncbi:hypothetical protein O6H91_06G047400 [Diphasiastrum complanatum]|uniref:Uncharacterized protein n=1 Tax=Diphasiastrum complanatum TaxID=34168 RepID=A0ACC2DD95_DIPCM|nr:hypothetical protein O6H91_06G047400 [Diphasiastrum complanatum]